MKITSKGQVTIPMSLRKAHGLLPETQVTFVSGKDGLLLKKTPKAKGRGEKIVERMKGSGNGKWTTDQIMKLMRD
jgi:bifunctional DNA-binding transcriptional regulator/antitoxin component of YhaV-PrlF toxin-antitoxin module